MRPSCQHHPPVPNVLSPLCGVLVALLASGCGRESPTALKSTDAYSRGGVATAGAAPGGAFFPLQIGNRWHAVAENRTRVEPVGRGPALEEFAFVEDITRVLIGTETLGGQPYTVEQETTFETGDGMESATIVTWVRYRQDGTGLYEADVATSGPPVLDGGRRPALHAQGEAATPRGTRHFPAALAARVPASELGAYRDAWDRLEARAAAVRTLVRTLGATGGRPGGLLAGEITRLRYPLHPRAEWVIRQDPLFTSAVEAAEVLELPAGRFNSWRIRIGAEFLGPSDTVHIWIGRSGQLALRYHLVSIATDPDGNEIGRLVSDWDEALEDLSLVRP